MLSEKGFEKVYNLSGGIKAWDREVAVGREETGLHLFTGRESLVDVVVLGFGLEMGLRDFYLSMQQQVTEEATKTLLGTLADLEIHHQKYLVNLYADITGTSYSVTEFGEKIAEPVMEGGMTTEEYLQLYSVDPSSELEVLSLALAIEAQALDLYLRAAERSEDEGAKRILHQIAKEERSHIAKLSGYIDQYQEIT